MRNTKKTTGTGLEGKLKSPRMLSEKQAAEIFGISPTTLRCWRWMKKGPKYYKVGGSVRYDPADIDVYLVGTPVETVDSIRLTSGGEEG